ncbi:MAG: hypothetical protein JW940_19130 [Polyangiaceae bacterium]|nr:hypothetical protein [Polyangiaceae bacterium]
MNTVRGLASASSILMLLGAIGCGAEPMADPTGDGEDVGISEQSIIGVPAWGGMGGSYFETPYGNFWNNDNIVGQYISQLWLQYDVGGSQNYWAGPYGSGGGQPDGPKSCTMVDEYFVGIYGRYTRGKYVDQLGFICGTADRSRPTYDLPVSGSSPGTYSFRHTCARGQIIVKVGGRAGSWLDQIQVLCGFPRTTLP